MAMEVEGFRHLDDVSNIVAGAVCGSADARDHPCRLPSGLEVPLNCRAQFVGFHRKIAIGGNLHQILASDAGEADGLVDRGVVFAGGVDAQDLLTLQPLAVPGPAQRSLPHREHCADGGRRGGVMDEAGEAGGQSHRIAEPIDHFAFKFGCGGGRLPQHAVAGHRIGKLFGDHGRR